MDNEMTIAWVCGGRSDVHNGLVSTSFPAVYPDGRGLATTGFRLNHCCVNAQYHSTGFAVKALL